MAAYPPRQITFRYDQEGHLLAAPGIPSPRTRSDFAGLIPMLTMTEGDRGDRYHFTVKDSRLAPSCSSPASAATT